MTYEELLEELAAARFRPAYLLLGSELLLRQDSLQALRDAVLADGPADFNSDRLEGPGTAPSTLADALGSLPVMGPRRLVELREPGSARGTKLTQALAEQVEAHRAAKDAPVVLVVTAAKANRREGWVKAFSGEAAVVECDSPKNPRAALPFVRAEAKRQGLQFEKGVAELLVERVGPQLLMLRQEIAKVGLLAGPEARVTRAHAEASASDVAEEPIWDLTDAIGEGRTGDALTLLSRMLKNGAPEPVVLGALAGHFRRLVSVRSGAAPSGPPFVVRKLERQAGRFSPGRLLTCLKAIQDADVALKGQGVLSPALSIERLVLGLAS